jgi:hypothetical protein
MPLLALQGYPRLGGMIGISPRGNKGVWKLQERYALNDDFYNDVFLLLHMNDRGAGFSPPSEDIGSSSASLLLRMDGANGSTVFADDSAYSHAVTPIGNAQISTAQSKFGGSSAYFDGNGDYLSIASSTSLDFGTERFAIEAWIYPLSLTAGTARVIVARSVSESNYPFQFMANGDKLELKFADDDAIVIRTVSSSVSLQSNTWQHVAVVRFSTGIFLFIDGAPAGRVDFFTDNFSASADFSSQSSSPLIVGANSGPSVSDYEFDSRQGLDGWHGYIDDLRITKGTDLYVPAFTFTDSSRFNRSVTAFGSAVISTAKSRFGGSSYDGDGSGDFLSIDRLPGSLVLTGDFTVECWIYPTTSLTGNRIFFGIGNESTGRMVFGLLGGVLGYGLFGHANVAFSDGEVSLNVWTHVAITRSGSTMRGFVNGALLPSTTLSGTLGNNNINPQVGQANNTAASFLGYIDEFRLTVGRARYESSFTPSERPFLP